MGLKIFAIILILFIAEITFLSTKEPKVLKVSKKDINYATIEFTALQGCTINQDGITQRIAAAKAQKFKTYETLRDVNASFQQNGILHTLKAKKGHFEGDILSLTQNVLYENNQSLHIKTQKLEYNIKTKVAKSPDTFALTSNQGIMIGDSFVYDMKNGTLEGQKMHYNFEADEK